MNIPVNRFSSPTIDFRVEAVYLFDLILLHPSQQFFSYVGTGLPWLGQY